MNGYINTQQTGARKIANCIRIDIERVKEQQGSVQEVKKKDHAERIS